MTYNEYYLQHHGILGQKWGVRRYQNEDGSLTEAGKKRYSSMDSEKLRKELQKNIKKERKKQYDFSNRFHWNSTIGPNSRKAVDEWIDASKKHKNSPEYKAFIKKIDDLDKKAEKGDIDFDTYDEKLSKLWNDYYQTESGKEAKRVSRYTRYAGNGAQQGKEYLESYGKNITIGYLKDLGFNDSGAEYIQKKLQKDSRGLG